MGRSVQLGHGLKGQTKLIFIITMVVWHSVIWTVYQILPIRIGRTERLKEKKNNVQHNEHHLTILSQQQQIADFAMFLDV